MTIRGHNGGVPEQSAVFEPHVIEVGSTVYTVRESVMADAERLLELYHRLGDDDLHRRFFSGFRPRIEFVEGWIDRSAKGGVVLVAVEGPPETGRIVADAGYVPTSSDVAELAITVDPDRRGWLGPYLLDVLVEHARLHGFAGLEAEVLTSNCSMLAMLRARGCAFEPSDDMSVAKVLIGTSGDAPSWPADADHPRVLVEGSSSGWPGALAAQRAGMSVLVCPGPERGRMRPCPLLHHGQCPLADQADAVIVALPRVARTTEPLLDAHSGAGTPDSATTRPTPPIGLSHPLHQFYGDLPGRDMFVVDPDATGAEAVEAIRRALRRAEQLPDESQPTEHGPDGDEPTDQDPLRDDR